MEYEWKIKEYVQEKEKNSVVWLIDSIKTELNVLAWKEWWQEKDKFHFFERLKNDKNLLTYAELKNKEWELKFWDKFKLQLLELKLSITCPYFSDFKIFLEDLKKWEKIDESESTITGEIQDMEPNVPWDWIAEQSGEWSDDISETGEPSESTGSTEAAESTGAVETTKATESMEVHTFCWVDLWNIQSYPYYKNSKTWVTWCSATAQMNGQNFWLSLPSGDAYDAGKKPGNNCLLTLPKDKKEKRPSKNWASIKYLEFKSLKNKSNFADIYVESKSSYWHRAVAFMDSTWQRYVLDPYIRVKWVLDTTPKKLQDYLSVRKVVKAHFYESCGYSDKELAYR